MRVADAEREVRPTGGEASGGVLPYLVREKLVQDKVVQQPGEHALDDVQGGTRERDAGSDLQGYLAGDGGGKRGKHQRLSVPEGEDPAPEAPSPPNKLQASASREGVLAPEARNRKTTPPP